MNKLAFHWLLLVLALWPARIQARVGGETNLRGNDNNDASEKHHSRRPTAASTTTGGGRRGRRKLFQHRKLQWAADEDAIPDQYIIVFSPRSNPDTDDKLIRTWLNNRLSGARVLDRFRMSLNAVVVKRISFPVLRLILQDSNVLYVEEVRCNQLFLVLIRFPVGLSIRRDMNA